ncbi:MAG: NnrU family protein [Pseudomonadota bacterium]
MFDIDRFMPVLAWGDFAGALLMFFVSHSLPVRPEWRRSLVTFLGENGFTLLYSLISLTAFAWLIAAAGRAPIVILWQWHPWQSHLTLLLMAAVCGLLAFAVATPNPFSFGGYKNDSFSSQSAGVIRYCRHPYLLALALWSFSHLVSNGSLAHAVMFATLGAFSVLGGRMIDRRKRRDMGSEWGYLCDAMATGSLGLAGSMSSYAWRLAFAMVLYAILLTLHPRVIGVNPLPMTWR